MTTLSTTKSGSVRNKYHTNTKLQAKLGILPESIKRLIPKSTLYGFTHYDYSKLFRFNKQEDCDFMLELAKKIVNNKLVKRIVKMYRAYNRLKTAAIHIFMQIKNINPHLKKYKQKIVTVINHVKNTIGLNNACRFFRISVSKFYSWLNQVNYPCPVSILKKCRHRWPNQITQKEEKIMRKCLHNPFFEGWAVYQIAVYALVHNILTVSIGTWYKYVKVLGFNFHKIRKKYNTQGIRALRPNKIWHMDVTVYKTIAHKKFFIYILIDNFSRFILSYKTALFLSGAICMNMIRDAYRKYLEPNQQKESETILICDGGSENNNKHVDGFLEQTIIPVRKLIAQKDIKFSNSLVEAFNKTLKYRHLFLRDITDFESLNKHLDKFIPEYNNIRPHCAHKYLTPAQAYFSKEINLGKIKKQYEKARKNRILENKKVVCPVCST